MTEEEEQRLVHFAVDTGKAGWGVDRDELLVMINNVMNVGVDERERQEAAKKVVKDVLRKHPDLMKLVDSGSLDPSRSKRANEKTRDTVFSKSQAQTRALHSEGKIPWKNCCDIQHG
jgi:hypothetical protein